MLWQILYWKEYFWRYILGTYFAHRYLSKAVKNIHIRTVRDGSYLKKNLNVSKQNFKNSQQDFFFLLGKKLVNNTFK